MSRTTTSSASFSWARAPIRRARSSDVKRPHWSPQSGSVEAAFPDQGGHGGRYGLVERVAGPEPRRGHGVRGDLEEQDALRPGEPLEHRFQPVVREAGPGADGEPGKLENPI